MRAPWTSKRTWTGNQSKQHPSLPDCVLQCKIWHLIPVLFVGLSLINTRSFAHTLSAKKLSYFCKIMSLWTKVWHPLLNLKNMENCQTFCSIHWRFTTPYPPDHYYQAGTNAHCLIFPLIILILKILAWIYNCILSLRPRPKCQVGWGSIIFDSKAMETWTSSLMGCSSCHGIRACY